MFETLALPALNRILRSNAWALDRLREHAGKTAHLACPPFNLRLTIGASGECLTANRDAIPDVTIVATPGMLLRAATRDEGAWRTAQVTGDVDFAGAIDYVRRNLEWDYEEDLSRVVGDVAAHRLAGGLRYFDRWARSAALNFAHGLAEYAIYEKPLVAGVRAVDEFSREVDALRDDTERLAKRLELIERKLPD